MCDTCRHHRSDCTSNLDFAEPSADRRALLTDSLVLEAARRLRDERAIEAAIAKAMQVRAELAALSSEKGRACSIQLDAAITDRNASEMRARITDGETLLEEGRRQVSAEARRRAVLGGLASLGYEVREGMGSVGEGGSHCRTAPRH